MQCRAIAEGGHLPRWRFDDAVVVPSVASTMLLNTAHCTGQQAYTSVFNHSPGPPRSLNQVPASAGVKAEMSHHTSIIQGSGVGPAAYVVTATDLRPLHASDAIVKFVDDTYLVVPAVSSCSWKFHISSSEQSMTELRQIQRDHLPSPQYTSYLCSAHGTLPQH